MAIFASTTLGTGDPSRAMSIKALEARAQALAAAQSKQEAPTSLPSPWQGAGLVMNQVADAFATKQADQAAAARRQDLANLMGQVGSEGPNPQQLAGITGADPELGKMYAQQAFSARQDAAARQAQKEAAAEAARVAEAAAQAQEGRLGARPHSSAGEIKADVASGKLTEEEGAGLVKKLTAPNAAEQKAVNEQQDANIELQSQIAGLREAQGLLNDNKVYSGGGAELKETAGKYVSSGILGTSDEMTKATQRYNQIVSPEVLSVLSKLKGASSDRDMMFAINTLNDKTADIATKKKALETLIPKVEAHLKASEGRLADMGGKKITVETPAPSGGAPAGTAPAATTAAGPQSVASEAEALALPPGTKFKLPDGRTGTAR